MSQGYFTTLAHYNAWANRRLYEACAQLAEDEYLKPRPVAFHSLHGVLNHVLVGDRLWGARIARKAAPKLTLDQILYGDFVALRIARIAEDDHILNLVSGIAESALDRPLAYTNLEGKRYVDPLRHILGHLFNHQTHHRGQAHALLSQTAIAPPALDLIFFLRDKGAAPH
jgi:uncharacterized damage-inducible protein DinB